MREPTFYGGQAIIEGVMMRGPRYFAVACRRASGEIVVREEPVPAFFTRFAWARRPFLRGIFALADALVLGMKSLMYSAELAAQDEARAATGEPTGKGDSPSAGGKGRGMPVPVLLAALAQPLAALTGGVPFGVGSPPGEGEAAGTEPQSVSSLAISGSAVLGFGLGIALFVLLPHLLTRLLEPVLREAWLLNLVEGGVRVAIVIGYLALIARLRHVQRLFQYHGAEHKAINAWERERSLAVEAAVRQSTLHPRCGTNFLLTVLLVKLLIYPFFGWPPLLVGFALRLALLPVVAAVSFEVIRLAGRYRNFAPLQWLVAPGLWTQRLTTREPEVAMLEVAQRALRAVIQREEPDSLSAAEPAATPA